MGAATGVQGKGDGEPVAKRQCVQQPAAAVQEDEEQVQDQAPPARRVARELHGHRMILQQASEWARTKMSADWSKVSWLHCHRTGHTRSWQAALGWCSQEACTVRQPGADSSRAPSHCSLQAAGVAWCAAPP